MSGDRIITTETHATRILAAAIAAHPRQFSSALTMLGIPIDINRSTVSVELLEGGRRSDVRFSTCNSETVVIEAKIDAELTYQQMVDLLEATQCHYLIALVPSQDCS